MKTCPDSTRGPHASKRVYLDRPVVDAVVPRGDDVSLVDEENARVEQLECQPHLDHRWGAVVRWKLERVFGVRC